jgi:hypothetical protein
MAAHNSLHSQFRGEPRMAPRFDLTSDAPSVCEFPLAAAFTLFPGVKLSASGSGANCP